MLFIHRRQAGDKALIPLKSIHCFDPIYPTDVAKAFDGILNVPGYSQGANDSMQLGVDGGSRLNQKQKLALAS
jgi:hypothetical protein